jgi:hypothetical protein
MAVIRPILLALALPILHPYASAQQPPASADPLPTAEAIMARVTANQDRSEAERGQYVYVQHARVVSPTTNPRTALARTCFR